MGSRGFLSRLPCGLGAVRITAERFLGGLRGGFSVADGPNPGPEMSTRLLEQAVRYSLGLPGVSTLVIGCHTVEQLRQNVQMVTAALEQQARQVLDRWS